MGRAARAPPPRYPARMATTASRRGVVRARVIRVRDGVARVQTDRLAGEEPMEIRAAGPGQAPCAVAVTMRTPGHDFELAAGFLFTEGVIGAGDVSRVAYCDDVQDADQRYNVVTVSTHRPVDLGPAARNFSATSSCGICGKAGLDAVEVRCLPLPAGPVVSVETLLGLPETMRAQQRIFDSTGGLHAAGLFDPEGRLLCLREDVGRHNAVDKVVGAAVLAGETPLGGRILLVSGRASFEVVQKAAVAGIPILAAVSAPSSLAMQAARRLGVTLIGFLRDHGFSVYSHDRRVGTQAGGREPPR